MYVIHIYNTMYMCFNTTIPKRYYPLSNIKLTVPRLGKKQKAEPKIRDIFLKNKSERIKE